MKAEAGELSAEAAALVDELQQAIQARFPDARFKFRAGPDGRVFLMAYTSADHDFVVQDLVAERTLDAMLSSDLHVHVFPRRAS